MMFGMSEGTLPAYVLPSLLNLFMLVDVVLANIGVSPHPKPNALGETEDGLDRIPLFPFGTSVWYRWILSPEN